MNGSASSSSQHIDAVKQLLLTLCNGACIACRPLCRMSVVIFGEFFLLLLRRSDAALLSQNVVCALLASLHHCETACNCKAGLFSVLPTSLYGCAGLFGAEREVTDLLCLMGRWIPFRVKQDHIGAVSLVKVISALASEMASDGVRRPVFEQLPAIFRLINSDASPADKISLSIHAIRCEGLCAIEAALAAISFVQLLDSSYSSNSHRY